MKVFIVSIRIVSHFQHYIKYKRNLQDNIEVPRIFIAVDGSRLRNMQP